MQALSLFWKFVTQAASSSEVIPFHAFLRADLRVLILVCVVAQALCSRMDHMLKSKGFRSGLYGGHRSFPKKSIFCCLMLSNVNFDPCAGAQSCWNVHGRRLKWDLAHGNREPLIMSLTYMTLLTLMPLSMKMSGVLPIEHTPAQTITDCGKLERPVNSALAEVQEPLGNSCRVF